MNDARLTTGPASGSPSACSAPLRELTERPARAWKPRTAPDTEGVWQQSGPCACGSPSACSAPLRELTGQPAREWKPQRAKVGSQAA